MANVTITACANSTPPANTVIATKTVGGIEHQMMLLVDNNGSSLGQSGASPLWVVAGNTAGSAAGSPIFSSITNLAGSAAGSPLFVSVNNLTGSAGGSPTFVSVANLAGSAGGSPLFVSVTNNVSASISNTACVIASSGSIVVTNALSASISNTVTVAQGASGANPWGVRILDGAGLAYGVSAASPLFISGGAAGGTSIADKGTFAEGTTNETPIGGWMFNTAASLTACQSGAVRINEWRALHATLRTASGNELGANVASPLFASISNLAGSAGGSPLFVSVTNSVSASISNTACVIVSSGSMVITNLQSASISNFTGSAAGSPTFVSITNLAGSAAGSPLFSSITNLAGSAAGSPLFVSVTNQVSASISNTACVIVSSGSLVVTNALSASISNTLTASAIQGIAACPAGAWPIVITDRASNYGFSNSPLAVTQDFMNVWWAGSLVAASQINLSSSAAACATIIASAAGKATIVIAATFTTSSCQFIGWIASGAAAASKLVQTAMPFGTFGGMDANRTPFSLWQFPSGSNAVMTTTSACNVAGTLIFIQVAS